MESIAQFNLKDETQLYLLGAAFNPAAGIQILKLPYLKRCSVGQIDLLPKK